MTIVELIKQGLYYARTCKSLWLFGFFVGLASGGSNGGGGGGGHDDAGGAAASGGFMNLSAAQIAALATICFLIIAAAIIMRFVAEGALIEGVVRARQGANLTMREGFRAGWAHWGVLVRIALLYFAATVASLVVLAAPCVIAARAFGPAGAILLGIPAAIIAVPWLVTLYLVQAFAWRIAVLENRHAMDAISKARLFLHGRLIHGLKVIVAAFAGTIVIAAIGVAVMLPLALVLVALIPLLQAVSVIVLAVIVFLPITYVFAAILGTFRSSVWTIGYVTEVAQVES